MMNHIYLGFALMIALNAQNCNENTKDSGTAAKEDPAVVVDPPTTTGSEKDIEVRTDEITGKRWFILSVNGGDLALPEGGERPWLEFSDGQLQGFGGCNNLMGSYTMENDRMSFAEVGSTKKYCPDIQATERSILDMLATVSNHRTEGRNSLLLLQGDREVAMLRTE